MKKRKNTNYVVNESIEEFGKVNLICKLDEKLKELNITLIELSHLTGVRYATLHELKANKKPTINIQHLLAIMVALRIKDLNELFELKFEDEQNREQFEKEHEEIYVEKNGLSPKFFEKMKENQKKIEDYLSALD